MSLTLAMPFARFYTRALYWDLGKATRGKPAARDGRRCRLSHQSLPDLRTWRTMTSTDCEGRPIHPPVSQAVLHSDAADVGYGGTLGTDDSAGAPGIWEAQGIWKWQDRAESISYRELKAIRMLLTKRNHEQLNSFGSLLKQAGVSNVKLWCDNMATVHVTNAMVSASRPMMRELRLLKRELDRLGLHIASAWLPSVLNKYADGLSRLFPRGDLQVRQWLRQSLKDGIAAPADAFPYRPLGETPYFQRRQTMQELGRRWGKEKIRLLCPPVDLIAPVVTKLRLSGSPAMLMIPDWPRQPWHRPALNLAQRVHRIEAPPATIWTAARKMNEAWRILILEVNMDCPSSSVSESLRARVHLTELSNPHYQQPALMSMAAPGLALNTEG